MIDNLFRQPIILVADDDRGDRELICRAFECCECKPEMHFVHDGVEALDYLHRTGKYTIPSSSPTPDIILLDLNMPKLNGFQVLKQIKSDEDLKSLNVIILSTSSNADDIKKSYQLGANSYITKPLDMDDYLNMTKIFKQYWFEIAKLPHHL